MDSNIKDFIAFFNPLTVERFTALYQLALDSTPRQVEEKVWAAWPTITCGRNFIRLFPFKGHINIKAAGLAA